LDEFSDALVAVLVAHALLAILEGFAFVVKLVLWCSLTHFRKRSVTEQVAVASVSPVLSLIKFVFAFHAGLCPDLFGNFFEIGVSALAWRQIGSTFLFLVFLASSDIDAADFNSARDADVIGDSAVFLSKSEADEKG